MSPRNLPPGLQQRERTLALPEMAAAADNTRRAHRRDIRYFWRWAEVAHGACESYPIRSYLLQDFVAQHCNGLAPDIRDALVAGGWSRGGRLRVTTLRRILASLSVLHLSMGIDNPCRDPAIHYRLRQRRRREGAPRRRRALTRPLIEQLCAACGNDIRGRRDRAIIAVGFAAGGLRRSEISQLDLERLWPDDNGFQLMLNATKTDAAGATLPVRGVAAEALRAWLAVRAERTGPVFVGLHRSGRQLARLSGRGVDRIVAARARQAGLDPTGIGAHSLRAGYLTEAGRRGLFLGDAMQMSRHRSLAVALGYYERGRLDRNPGADLLSD